MKSSTFSKFHWLEMAEIAAVAASVGGSIAGIFFKQFLWATIPLSASAGLAIVNHQRLKQSIESDRQAIAILVAENQASIDKLETQYDKTHQSNKTNFDELNEGLSQIKDSTTAELAKLQQEQQYFATTSELKTLQSSVAKLDDLSQKLEENLTVVDEKQKETGKLVRELKAIDIFTQNIKGNLNTIQSYFERGYTYQRLGNRHRAIEDYTKTLELDSSHIQAYHNRGLLYQELSQNQKAVIDLRKASQLYFDKGDLNKYRETRDLSHKIHQNQSKLPVEVKEKDVESVSVGNLFG